MGNSWLYFKNHDFLIFKLTSPDAFSQDCNWKIRSVGGVLDSEKQAGSDTTILGTLTLETETQEQCKD